MTHAEKYFEQVSKISEMVDCKSIEKIATALADLRIKGGRLFLIGVGGSAANCSHAVNDFRKITGIEAYAPTDNVSELTARTNDEGWETIFEAWLTISKANENDALMVFSVGGGSVERNVSVNIVRALDEAKRRNLKIFGIVGRDGGYTKMVGDEVIVIPTVDSGNITPHTEAFQAIVWHCLVCHPLLQLKPNKWENITKV
jgi:D-sedoheptulose 7-phosphate isomerase